MMKFIQIHLGVANVHFWVFGTSPFAVLYLLEMIKILVGDVNS